MDWANERYIRFFTRETAEVRAWCWQARTIWPWMMARCDRAGVIQIRDDGRRVKLLAGLLNLPFEVVSPGIVDLLDDRCVVENEVGYTLVNFIEAQETAMSDKQRAKESRATRRERGVTKRDAGVQNEPKKGRGRPQKSPKIIPDLIITNGDDGVTKRDKASRNVTGRHKTTENVTPTQAKPTQAKPIIIKPPPPPTPPPPPQTGAAATAEKRAPLAVEEVAKKSSWPELLDSRRVAIRGDLGTQLQTETDLEILESEIVVACKDAYAAGWFEEHCGEELSQTLSAKVRFVADPEVTRRISERLERERLAADAELRARAFDFIQEHRQAYAKEHGLTLARELYPPTYKNKKTGETIEFEAWVDEIFEVGGARAFRNVVHGYVGDVSLKVLARKGWPTVSLMNPDVWRSRLNG